MDERVFKEATIEWPSTVCLYFELYLFLPKIFQENYARVIFIDV